MDPVSITLGVVPLVGGAMKTYKIIHRKLKTFCHYSREVKQVQKLLDRQSHFFTNEVHLLLRDVVDDEQNIQLMLKDVHSPRWQSKELEVRMRKILRQNYDVCRGVIEEVDATMQRLQQELRCFDELAAECGRGELLKDAVRRLRKCVKITWNKAKYEEFINELRASNADLQRLREQACELDQSRSSSLATQRQRKQIDQEYSQFGTVRRASKALHEALATAWSARSATDDSDAKEQLRHTVRLFLDAKVQEEVNMELVICCFGHEPSNRNSAEERFTRLHVRSQLRDWMESRLQTPTDPDCHENSNDSRRKRRRVRFMPDKHNSSSANNQELGQDCQADKYRVVPPADLCSGNLCSTLCKSSSKAALKKNSTTPYLGYVDSYSQQVFRHCFYRSPDDRGVPQSVVTLHGITSLSEILSHPIESSLGVVDQLKLARNLASAVLKFYSTPWLKDYFSLCDLFIFRLSQDLSSCLQTLHVGLDFTQIPFSPSSLFMDGTVSTSQPNAIKGRQLAQVVEDAKLQYGVRNLTLWSLGTILLQIGRWSTIDVPDDVINVRRLSAQVPSLGPKYRDLTRKCLECDFAYGDDLSKPRLQQAVHENLVCELNDMISILDINDDDEEEGEV